MQRSEVPVNRRLVGVLTIACLIAAAGFFVFESTNSMFGASFLRVGLLLAAFWIALPTAERDAAWANISWMTLAGLLLAALVVVRYPRVAIPLLVVAGTIAYFLRPKKPRRPGQGRQQRG